MAHGRLAVGRFDDPPALALLRDGERAPVDRARRDVPPTAWSHKMDVQLLGRQAEAMSVRTVAVDDAVRTVANPQLVVLGAGLDGRAWRTPELVRAALDDAGLMLIDDFDLRTLASELSVPDRHLGTSRVAVCVSGGGRAPVRR